MFERSSRLLSCLYRIATTSAFLANMYQDKLYLCVAQFSFSLHCVAELMPNCHYSRYYPRIGPEARLFAACAAGIIVPVGWCVFPSFSPRPQTPVDLVSRLSSFIYAWTSYETVHWIGPCIGMTIMIFGIFQVVSLAALVEEQAES